MRRVDGNELRLGWCVGLWCSGSTAPRQGRRCGFESRQVHSFDRRLRRNFRMKPRGRGAVLRYLKLIDYPPYKADNYVDLDGVLKHLDGLMFGAVFLFCPAAL